MKGKIIYGFCVFITLISFFFTLSSTMAGPDEAVREDRVNTGASNCSWIGPDGKALPFSTNQEVEQFLLTAKVVSFKVIQSGVNTPWKILLEKNGVLAYAIFRYQSEVRGRERTIGSTSLGRYFRDSYVSELAAYRIHEVLGVHNMPPTVHRKIKGRSGSLQLWLEEAMSNLERNEKNIIPPDPLYWNQQYYDLRVFDNLINNTDRNQSNLMIDKDWHFWLIDHTRSFARDTTLPNPREVTQCSKRLWKALNQMDQARVRESLTTYLSEYEVNAFFARHAALIQLIEDRIKTMGEEAVLFESKY